MQKSTKMNKKLKMGMIGGGFGSAIGDVHRKSASMDGIIELVCGAFSSTAEKSISLGKELLLKEDRCYGNYAEMLRKEKELPEDIRMDFVTIVTPNHMHFPPAKMALENGFHVISDKPITLTLDEAIALKKIIIKSGKLFALTHNYTGHPMVKQAKALIEDGKLGENKENSSAIFTRMACYRQSKKLDKNKPFGEWTLKSPGLEEH